MANRVAITADVNNSTYSDWISAGGLAPMQEGDIILDTTIGGTNTLYFDNIVSQLGVTMTVLGSGNNSGDPDYVVTSGIPSNMPQQGVIKVTDGANYDFYKISSWTGNTFTLDATAHPSGLARTYSGTETPVAIPVRIGATIWVDAVALNIASVDFNDVSVLGNKDGGNNKNLPYISEFDNPLTIRPLRGKIRCKNMFFVGIEHLKIDGNSNHYPGLRDPFKDSNFLYNSFGINCHLYDYNQTMPITIEHADNVLDYTGVKPSVRLRGIDVYGGFAAMRIWQGGNASDEVTASLLSITDCYLHDGESEGTYVGHTGNNNALNPRTEKLIIKNLVLARRGTESLQHQAMINNASEKIIENVVIIGGAADWIAPFQDFQSGTAQLQFGDGNFEFRNSIVDSYIDNVAILFGSDDGTAQGTVRFRRLLTANGWEWNYHHPNLSDSPGLTFEYEQIDHIKPHTKRTRTRSQATDTFTYLYGQTNGGGELIKRKHLRTESGFPATLEEDSTGEHIVAPTNEVVAVRNSPAYINAGLGYNNDDSDSGGYDFLGIWGNRIWPVITIASMADNGSGIVRATTSANHFLNTNDPIFMSNSGVYANGKYTVTRISDNVIDIQGLSYISNETFTAYVGHPANYFVDEVVAHHDWASGAYGTHPGVKFYKCLATHTVDQPGDTPDVDTTNWVLLRWDVNGIRSDKAGYTGTPDPDTGGWFPPDNVLLPASDQWNRKGYGLLVNPHPDNGTIFKWYIADDAAGTNKVLIPGAKNPTFDLNDEYWDWVAVQTGKYIVGSVTPQDVNGKQGTEVFGTGFPIAQSLINGLVDLADYSFTVYETYQETSLTTLAAPISLDATPTNESQVQGLKAFGNNIPAATNANLTIQGDTDDAVNVGEYWYTNAPFNEKSYPHLIDNGGADRYLRIRNGASYRPLTINVSPALTRPYDEFYLMRRMPGPWNETTFKWKVDGSKFMDWDSVATTDPNNYNDDFFKLELWRVYVDGSGNWEIWRNGVSQGTGVGANPNLNAFWLGSNGHPMDHQFFMYLAKFGQFSVSEVAQVEETVDKIWKLNSYPSYPCYDNIHWLASTQWNSTTKEWDLNRNKTVTFFGGNGTEGATTYQWYYWDDSDAVTFPIQNKLDEHKPFPGADGQNSTLNRNHYISGNGRGNPTIFNNPGVAGNVWVMCVITPYDSAGAQGERIVSQWTQDNIA